MQVISSSFWWSDDKREEKGKKKEASFVYFYYLTELDGTERGFALNRMFQNQINSLIPFLWNVKDKVYCLWLHYLWNIVIKMKQPLIHLRPCTKKGRQDCCQQCRIFVPLLIVCCVNQESLFNPTLIRSQSLIIHSNNQVLVKVSKPYPQVSWLLKITSVMPLERSAHYNLQNVFSFFIE